MMLGEAKGAFSVYAVNFVKTIILVVLTLLMAIVEAVCVDERASNYDLRVAIYWLILLAPIMVGILKVKSNGLSL